MSTKKTVCSSRCTATCFACSVVESLQVRRSCWVASNSLGSPLPMLANSIHVLVMVSQGQILDVPIPEDCHAEHNADYGGAGVSWGLDYKKDSAAACCQACKDHANQNPSSQPCNVWVWCGEIAFKVYHVLLDRCYHAY